MRLDMRVHGAVYAATHNPQLENTGIGYGEGHPRLVPVPHPLDRMPAHVEQHEDLLSALLDGYADRAAHIARLHVIEFDKAVRAVARAPSRVDSAQGTGCPSG